MAKDGDSSSFATSQGSHTNTNTPNAVDPGWSEGGNEDENRPSRENIESLAGLFCTGNRRVEDPDHLFMPCGILYENSDAGAGPKNANEIIMLN